MARRMFLASELAPFTMTYQDAAQEPVAQIDPAFRSIASMVNVAALPRDRDAAGESLADTSMSADSARQ